jgi:hypothetical protein
MEAWWETPEPTRGQRGNARPRHVTANASATRPTAHGGLPGYHSQASVEATPHGLRHAEACGTGQDDGPVAPLREGATAHAHAMGRPGPSGAGKIWRAASHAPRAEPVKTWAPAQVDADRPDPHGRQRDPRVAPPDRHPLPTEATGTGADVTDEQAPEGSTWPPGTRLTREARRHTLAHHLDRRSAADEVDDGGGPWRERCVPTAATRRNHLAVGVEHGTAPLSQQMIAHMDTAEARQIDGERLALVAPVVGTIRSQTRVERLPWRGQVNVTRPWRLSGLVHTREKIVHEGLAVCTGGAEHLVLHLVSRRSSP